MNRGNFIPGSFADDHFFKKVHSCVAVVCECVLNAITCVEHSLRLSCVYFFPIILSSPPVSPLTLSSYSPRHLFSIHLFSGLLFLRPSLSPSCTAVSTDTRTSGSTIYPTSGCPIRASGHFTRKASTRHVSSAPSSSILAISVENASFCFFATLFFSFSAARNSSSFLPCRRVRGTRCA